MAVLRPLVVDHPRKADDDSAVSSKLVRLREADLVRDEPGAAIREGLGEVPTKFARGGKAQDALATAQSWSAAAYTISPFESEWAAPDVDETLGRLITATREKRRISRERVTEQTCIPAHYLRMIESDNYDAVPDELYLLPFVRRYAIFLGLDPQKVVSRFISDFEKAKNEVQVVETSVPSVSGRRALIWQRVALAAMIVGALLPCLRWAIGTVRTTVSHPGEGSSTATPSTTTHAPSKGLPTYAPPVAAVQQPAQAPADAVAPPATTSLSPKVDQQPTQGTPHGLQGRRYWQSRRPRHRR